MHTITRASLILGLTAMMAAAGAPATNNNDSIADPSACSGLTVKAKQETVWSNLLEGGPIKAVVGVAAHSKHYRDIVCAEPDVDWSTYGPIEVESVNVVPANLKKPLSEHQVEVLKTALQKALDKQLAKQPEATDPSARPLRIRATITEVRRTNAILNIVTLAAIQTPVSFGGASAHFELLDGLHGGRVGDVTLRGSGRLYEVFPSVTTLGDTKNVLTRATKQLSKEIEMLRESSASRRTQVVSNTAGQ
jgi:hypothetical protein